jgi:hypothetical protein
MEKREKLPTDLAALKSLGCSREQAGLPCGAMVAGMFRCDSGDSVDEAAPPESTIARPGQPRS